ncbi:tandem-95 repeat protein [Psychrobacter sp. AOP7-D1-21]|uniref:tandem-95 repeat protein n=1 Tax=Psychrobacter sp. AOP7-D1-21 TaxID=3457636 RepID=UPI00402B41C0
MAQATQLILQKNNVNLINQVLNSNQPTKIAAEEGMQITLVDAKTGQPAKKLQAKKVADDLLIADENGEVLLTIEDYYLTDNVALGTVSDVGFVEFDYVSTETGTTTQVASETSYTTLVSEMLGDASLIGGISNGVLLGSIGAAALGVAAISSGSSDSSSKPPANELPVSKDSIITAIEDTTTEGQLEAATDVDGNTLTYALDSDANNGTAVVNADGSYSYTPDANFNGSDSFTYTIDDGQGGVTTQTATIDVAPINDAPVAEDSSISTDEDTEATGTLAAATDVDGNTLTYALDSDANNGTAVVNADGSYSYTPNANFNGEDSFTYSIDDGQGGVITQTATITVAAVNDVPVAENSSIGVAENFVDTGMLAEANDVDGDELTFTLDTDASNGIVVVNADGSYSYTPNADFKGEDSFTYSINDGNGETITKSANVTVSSFDQAFNFELQEAFETEVVSELQTVVDKQATSYINDRITFEVTGDNGTPSLVLSNGSNVIQGSYSYTLQGPGISASTSGSISSVGSSSYSVDFRTSTLPPGKYTLDLYVNSRGSSIDFNVTELKDVESTNFAGYQEITGNIFADEDGNINTPASYKMQLDGQSLVNTAADSIILDTDNGKLTLEADGSYSYLSDRNDLDLEAEKLAEDFYVKVIDLDTKQASHYGINITSDTTPPESGELVLNNFEDTGISKDDGVTQDNTFDLTIKNNETGSQVEYQYSTDHGATWTVLVNGEASNLADGDYSFRAKVTDESLNESLTAVKDITIDTTVPFLGDILNFNTATNQLEVNADIDQDTLQAFKSENGTLKPLDDATNIAFAEGDYQIKASDVAGNSTSLDFVMSTASEYFESADIIDIIKGSAGDDYIYGGDGDDILISSGGRDVLDGEAGGDTLILGSNSSGISTTFMSGGKDNDTYIIGATELSGSGYGVTILDHYGSNTLKLKDIDTSDVVLTRVDTELKLSIEGREISINNQFGKGLLGTNSIDNIIFDDGTAWDKATIESMINTNSARSMMSFDEEENSNTEIDIFADSQQVELPNIDDLLDVNNSELTFESADTMAITKETTTGFSGASEPSIAADFTIVQALNDNMQTEATFHIM